MSKSNRSGLSAEKASVVLPTPGSPYRATVLADLADAEQTLAWLAERVDLDGEHATRFRLLMMHAERLKKMRDDELDALNGGGE